MGVFSPIPNWRKERQSLLVEAEFAESLQEFERLIGLYHQAGIRIQREERAIERAESSTALPLVNDIYWPTNHNNKVSLLK